MFSIKGQAEDQCFLYSKQFLKLAAAVKQKLLQRLLVFFDDKAKPHF